MLFRELVTRFLIYCRQNRARRTAEFYEHQLGKMLPLVGELDALAVKTEHVYRLKVTWHLVLSLQRLYNWAVEEHELLPFNPLRKLKRPRLGKRRRVLTPIELVRLLRRASSDFRRFLLAARESAARPQELAVLCWQDLRWEGPYAALCSALRDGLAYFHLDDYKGRDRRSDPTTPRVIPVSPRLGRLLWRLHGGRPLLGRIFRTSAGQDWHRNKLRSRMKRVLVGLGQWHKDGRETVCCYTLRHTTATALAAAGWQMSVLQTLLGHANIKTTARYVHVHVIHLRDAWQAHWAKRRRRRDS